MVSALGVVWIMLSCGLAGSSMKALCTWIKMVTALLLLPIAIPQNAPPNNTEQDTSSRLTIPYDLATCQNSSVAYENPLRTKFDTSTVENMAMRINAPTITCASLTSNSTIKYYGKITKDFTPTHHHNSKSFGRSDSRRSRSLTSKPLLTLHATHSKKSPAKKPMTTIYAATNMASPPGYSRNIFVCPLAAKNLAA